MTRHESAERRRRQILDALGRVIARDGITAASVRNVAAEAGLSASALRYHFTDQDSLLTAPLLDAVEVQLAPPSSFTGTPQRQLAGAMRCFIPSDDEAIAAAKLTLGLVVAGFGNPAVAAGVQERYRVLRSTLRGWLAEVGVPAPRRPAGVEDLVADIDGIAVGVTGGTMTAAAAGRVIARRCETVVDGGPS